MIRQFIKYILSNIGYDLYMRGVGLNLMKHEFKEVYNVICYENREGLWDNAIERLKDNSIVFLEFGVWEGYSINYFSKKLIGPDSSFYGFDSFEGLPEKWYTNPKGEFDLNGKMPVIKDERVTYHKGWFHDTLPEFLDHNLSLFQDSKLIIHYDADLYSSTLFCLTQVDKLKTPYLAIFDEFVRDETRALYDYKKSYGATINILGYTKNSQMLCEIVPYKSTK